jgi:hypothetical protein
VVTTEDRTTTGAPWTAEPPIETATVVKATGGKASAGPDQYV